MSYCVKQAEKTQNLSKIGGFHFFFSRPQAGLTNQDHVRHYDTRVPLRQAFNEPNTTHPVVNMPAPSRYGREDHEKTVGFPSEARTLE